MQLRRNYAFMLLAVAASVFSLVCLLRTERLLSSSSSSFWLADPMCYHGVRRTTDWKATSVSRPQRKRSEITHVVSWNGNQALKDYMNAYFHEKNAVCDAVNEAVPVKTSYHDQKQKDQAKLQDTFHRHVLVNITFGCQELFAKSGLGTGNFMAGFYAIRLAALARNADVSIVCDDAEAEKKNLILPWLTGYYYSGPPAETKTENESSQQQRLLPSSSQQNLDTNTMLKRNDDAVCKTIDECPIGRTYPQMRYELRRMAVALVGIPKPTHSTFLNVNEWLSSVSQDMSQNEYARMQIQIPSIDDDITSTTRLPPRLPPPLYPNIELDDAILHFRCGDLMNSNHPRFGFLRFESFVKHISPQVQSIGVVTQPFDIDDNAGTTQSREWDRSAETRRRCRVVVTDLMRYLQNKFPKARLALHNSANETIALTYARLIMANQTIAGISTFGVFAAIASFGTGYIRLPDKKSPTNKWLLQKPRLDTLLDDLVLMKEPDILKVRKVRAMWEEPDGQAKILAWFRNTKKQKVEA